MTGRGTGCIWLLHTGNPHRWRPGSGSGVQETACEPDGHEPAARAGASRTKIRTTPPPFVGGVRGRRRQWSCTPGPAGCEGGRFARRGLDRRGVGLCRRSAHTGLPPKAPDGGDRPRNHFAGNRADGRTRPPGIRPAGRVRLLAGEAARPAWQPAPSRPVARNGSSVAGPGSTRRDSTGTTAGVRREDQSTPQNGSGYGHWCTCPSQ